MSERKSAVVPPASIGVYPTGHACTETQPGDIILVRFEGGTWIERLPGAAIRLGERMRPSTRPFAWCEHAMVVEIGGPNAVVIQETAAGAVRTPLSAFARDTYVVISPDIPATDLQRAAAVEFARWTLGTGYGWGSIVGDALEDLTGLHLSVGTYGRMVCSSAACRAAERWGVIPDKDPTAVQPADIARYFDVTTLEVEAAIARLALAA